MILIFINSEKKNDFIGSTFTFYFRFSWLSAKHAEGLFTLNTTCIYPGDRFKIRLYADIILLFNLDLKM